MNDVIVVVPTYNEAGNLPELAGEVLAQPVPNLRILVVDDDSPDGTGRVADELAARTSGRVAVIHRQGPRGLGRAYVDGFREALSEGADSIVQMDADFSHSPGDIARLIDALFRADVAVGSRYVPGGSVDAKWGLRRQSLSRTANTLARKVLGLKTHDATAGFKAWRREALEAVDVGRVRSNGYLLQVEMTYIAERLGLRIEEVPIYFLDRHVGRSKMTTRVKVEAAAGLLGIKRLHRHIEPVHWQGPSMD